MAVRAYVTFDDALTPVPDADGGHAAPAGQGLAQELSRSLEGDGFPIVAPVSPWDPSYGWEFTVSSDGRAVWFMLQASDNWLVISDVPRTWLERLRGVNVEEPHARVLSRLAQILAAPRFTSVKWFTKAEFEGGHTGVDSPTG